MQPLTVLPSCHSFEVAAGYAACVDCGGMMHDTFKAMHGAVATPTVPFSFTLSVSPAISAQRTLTPYVNLSSAISVARSQSNGTSAAGVAYEMAGSCERGPMGFA